MTDIIIVGAGAGGFFTAINIAERFPEKNILILEKGKEPLTKVRISGGGRCNVTNAETSPEALVKQYPRGEKELLGVFHRFGTAHTRQWFENKGVRLVAEPDGRVFPQSNTSQTIIDCFLNEAKKHRISVLYKHNVTNISHIEGKWCVEASGEVFSSEKLVIATGSNPKMWHILQHLGHSIVPPVPSLFTFHTSDTFIEGMAGVSAWTKVFLLDEKASPLKIKTQRVDRGGITAPLLITHWGFSGPAVLKLSAWGARVLAERDYQFTLQVNWLTEASEAVSFDEARLTLQQNKDTHARKLVSNHCPFELPKRLWHALLERAEISLQTAWASLSKGQIQQLAQVLTASVFVISGKSTFKEEFVTAGGVSLKEIDFKTFSSKLFPTLYFTGEVLDIDAVTGGFNFQNAWSGGYIIAQHIY